MGIGAALTLYVLRTGTSPLGERLTMEPSRADWD